MNAADTEGLQRLAATLRSDAPSSDLFEVELWVARALLDGAWRNSDSFAVLFRLSRKIEIARRLCRTYDRDIRKPASDQRAEPPVVAALCGVFLAWAEYHNDFRFLNTVLKVDGGILSPSAVSLPVDLREWAERLVWDIARVA